MLKKLLLITLLLGLGSLSAEVIHNAADLTIESGDYIYDTTIYGELEITNCKNWVFFSNCTFANNGGDCIRMDNSDVMFVDCHFYAERDCIQSTGKEQGLWISGCNFYTENGLHIATTIPQNWWARGDWSRIGYACGCYYQIPGWDIPTQSLNTTSRILGGLYTTPKKETPYPGFHIPMIFWKNWYGFIDPPANHVWAYKIINTWWWHLKTLSAVPVWDVEPGLHYILDKESAPDLLRRYAHLKQR